MWCEHQSHHFAAIASSQAAIAANLTFIEEQEVSVEKFSLYKAAQRLGISRITLLKELEDGHIVAHKRRDRIVFFDEDLRDYEKKNMIDRRETRINLMEAHDNLMLKKPVAQN